MIGRIGEAAAWAISGVAWALSFTAQMQLASVHDFTSWEVWAWPATTDLAGLVGMLIALDQSRRNRSTAVAWAIALAAAAVMVAANIGAAVGDPVAMLLHAWPPTIALACWFLLVHVRRSSTARIRTMPTAVLVRDRNPRARVAARAEVRRLLKRHGSALTAERIRDRTGVSIQRARTLLREESEPHVVDGRQ